MVIDFLLLINKIEVSVVIGLSIYFSIIGFHTNCPRQNRLEGNTITLDSYDMTGLNKNVRMFRKFFCKSFLFSGDASFVRLLLFIAKNRREIRKVETTIE